MRLIDLVSALVDTLYYYDKDTEIYIGQSDSPNLYARCLISDQKMCDNQPFLLLEGKTDQELEELVDEYGEEE